ncbi:MAG: YbaK/EbsC family protein [Thermoprotei archaeon]
MPVEPVLEWIRKHGVEWRIIRASEKTTTVDDAARVLGVDKSRIVKTLIVIAGDEVYAVVIPGDKRLDMSKLASITRSKPRLAKPREVIEKTGYPVGGVPPIALPSHVKLVIDKSILKHDKVYGGGGEDGILLEFNPRELVELVKPLITELTK